MSHPPSGPILRLVGVSKRYPGTLAVNGVDFEVLPGEVHALMGENGAGKSSLMNMIAGSFDDYTGDIFLRGQKVELHSPAKAKALGIAMIHQELSLAQPLSILENILAGRLPKTAGVFLDRAAATAETRRCLRRVGLDHLDPWQLVETLSQHEAQLVEIAKAIGGNPSILVMDEPTSALSRAEVVKLFEIIRQLKGEGLSVIYISHHLPEVFEVADRVTVMRDGKKVATRPMSETTPAGMVELMIGRAVSETRIMRKQAPGEVRLAVKNFSRYGFFHDLNFAVRRGEILGIGGLAGSGRSELARSLVGIDPCDAGEARLDGEDICPANLREAMQCGLGYLTEDRKMQGLALNLDLETNALAALNAKASRLVAAKRGRAVFEKQAADLQLYPAEPGRLASQLSGGNQQKVLLAKWLAIEPEVLILDEPTRGVDIGAKQVIHEAIGRLADAGKSVIVISSDLPELCMLSDRILILHKGHFVGEQTKGQFTEDSVLLAAYGEGAGEGAAHV